MARPANTRYLKSIKAPRPGLLKKGSQNKKLGFKITRGRWKGKVIYSLTLVERATCPPSCHHWEDCYGDNMPFAHRFENTPDLIPALRLDLSTLMFRHPNGIVVRLHVLGDFYSLDYVAFWREMLMEYPTLSIFGYSARIGCAIGRSLVDLNNEFPQDCVIRFSTNKVSTDGLLYASEESFEGPSFTCPEQTKLVSNCANCALCWSSPRTVRFLSH